MFLQHPRDYTVPPPLDRATFRKVLGHYPTGVCVITSLHKGAPVGMVVGSFTSVSLDPPLVAFLPDRNSRSWEMIRAAGRFCVNVLGAHQLDVCKAIAAGGKDKFSTVAFSDEDAGLPVIRDVVA